METGKVVKVAGFKIEFAKGLTELANGYNSQSEKISRVHNDTTLGV